ncbi:MAG TPA: hypothetical protein PLX02_04040 [Syntrophorhabdaceae bacterium]|nr:hypothetical protein [Syntrophorhabdaceae bacterium]HQM80771.1 hypothetical protein [Syntrophorhabdaceae bacterium]
MNSEYIYNGTAAIPGGYYLKPRLQPAIKDAPPHVREIFDYLLGQANYQDRQSSGRLIKRGQCFRTYEDIQEALVWYVGYRKMRYTKSQVEAALKWLRKHNVITTAKTTRGMIITVLNYDYYQTPANYENHGEDQKKTTGEPQPDRTINNEKKEKEEKRSDAFSGLSTGFPSFYFKDIKDLKDHERTAVAKYLKEVFKKYCRDNNITNARIYPVNKDKIIAKLIQNAMSPAEAVNFIVFYVDVVYPKTGQGEPVSLLKCFSPSYLASYQEEWHKVSRFYEHQGKPDTGISWWKDAKLRKTVDDTIRKEIIRFYRTRCRSVNATPSVTKTCSQRAVKFMKRYDIDVEQAKSLIAFVVDTRFALEGEQSLGECLEPWFYKMYQTTWAERKSLYGNREKPLTHMEWWK